MNADDWGYLIAWEFWVREQQRKKFENIYGPGGHWAQLFSHSEAYLGTELTRDAQNPGRYVTLDYWSTGNAYAEFRAQHAREYETLDAECEELTEKETIVGMFERIRP